METENERYLANSTRIWERLNGKRLSGTVRYLTEEQAKNYIESLGITWKCFKLAYVDKWVEASRAAENLNKLM